MHHFSLEAATEVLCISLMLKTVLFRFTCVHIRSPGSPSRASSDSSVGEARDSK